MGVRSISQALNKFLLHHEEDLTFIDEETVNLIKEIALHIINQDPAVKNDKRPLGYVTNEEFVKDNPFVSKGTLIMMARIMKEGDFYKRVGRFYYFHPEKTFQALQEYSPRFRKKAIACREQK